MDFYECGKFIPYGLEDAPEYEIFDRYIEMFEFQGLTRETLKECHRPPQPSVVRKSQEERFREADDRVERWLARNDVFDEDPSSDEEITTEDVSKGRRRIFFGRRSLRGVSGSKNPA